VERTLLVDRRVYAYGGKLGESEPAGAVFGAPPRSLLIAVMYLLKLVYIFE